MTALEKFNEARSLHEQIQYYEERIMKFAKEGLGGWTVADVELKIKELNTKFEKLFK
jgi:hypothetical protein